MLLEIPQKYTSSYIKFSSLVCIRVEIGLEVDVAAQASSISCYFFPTLSDHNFNLRVPMLLILVLFQRWFQSLQICNRFYSIIQVVPLLNIILKLRQFNQLISAVLGFIKLDFVQLLSLFFMIFDTICHT